MIFGLSDIWDYTHPVQNAHGFCGPSKLGTAQVASAEWGLLLLSSRNETYSQWQDGYRCCLSEVRATVESRDPLPTFPGWPLLQKVAGVVE